MKTLTQEGHMGPGNLHLLGALKCCDADSAGAQTTL